MVYEPEGLKFYDRASRREMMLVRAGPASGWLLYRHPDGQWVTLRKASDDDYLSLHQHRDDGSQRRGKDGEVDA